MMGAADAAAMMPRSVDGYTTPLTEAGRAAVEALVAGVAYRSNPCIVVAGIPAWIMPNGLVRVGSPDAPAQDAAGAAAEINQRKEEG